jgi:hypothetical protein
MKSSKRVAGLVFVAVVVIVLAATSAYAQGAPGGMQPGQGGPGGQGQRQMGQMQPAPAIAVADGFVFVVYGGTLFQFTIDGLKLVNQFEFPRPQRGNRGGGGGPQGGPPAGAPPQ